MKKIVSLGLCFLLILGFALPARAANGVPKRVMDATKSVVRILSEYKRSSTTGSGFVIKNEPGEVLIVTNNHVVADKPLKISIWVGEDELVEAEIVFANADKDLCVLRITEELDMVPLTLAMEDPEHGSAIYAAGYPGAADVLSDTQAHTSESVTITDGIISSIRSYTNEKGGEAAKLLLINAAINPGNSGGPLFNAKGEVIGVNTYGVSGEDVQGVFGSVAISELWALLEYHDIVLVEETEPTEPPTEAPPPPPEPEPEPFPIGLVISAGAAVLAVVLLLILKAQKKKKVTLRAYMASRPQGMGTEQAVAMLMSITIGLRNRHNDGKFHWQINPDNILITPKGASLKDSVPGERNRHCPGFAAPEVYKGVGIGMQSDVYSLAALLMYAVLGQEPANALHRHALEDQFALLEMKAPDLAPVIRRSMAQLPQERTASMQELIYGISAFQADAFRPVFTQKPKPKKKQKTKEKTAAATVAAGKPKYRGVPLPVVLLLVALSAALLWKPYVQPVMDAKEESARLEQEYAAAVQLQEAEDYPAAMEAFAQLENYQDCSQRLEECRLAMEQLAKLQEQNEIEAAYQQAVTWLQNKEYGKAAIAFAKLDGYKDARERSFEAWREVPGRRTLAYQYGPNYNRELEALLEDWSVIGYDGKVDIENVVSLYNGVYLRYDGTLDTGRTESQAVQQWSDLVSVSVSVYDDALMGLKSDGTVVLAYTDPGYIRQVEQWKDIVEIANGGSYFLGLKADGTVVAAGGTERNPLEVSDWTDVVHISARNEVCYGVRSDGSVVACGGGTYGFGDARMAMNWKDVLVIRDAYAILEDGTAKSRSNSIKAYQREIVDVLSDEVVLCADGGIFVVSGRNGWASTEYMMTKDWTNIQIPKY